MVSAFKLRQATQYLRQGGIIAYPTEAVYGLGCDPFNHDAVDHLLVFKGRAAEKGFILIAADIAAVEPLVDFDLVFDKQAIYDSWPGPVTWVLHVRDDIPEWLKGMRNSIAVRVTKHPVAAPLCRAFGGVVISTSANKSGKAPARTAIKVRKYFPSSELFVIPGHVGSLSQPTQIFDSEDGKRLR
ncbi:MAG: Sua5/YciO/YrdC/YwlC family protein [Gammaproteobacteria bacterium]